ncbi:unnamed protein product [Amoebophrya sp. A120]|nr:unnamed protein product [Amoebophrya sp. A120]|eukprot:GSA120T00009683001.1
MEDTTSSPSRTAVASQSWGSWLFQKLFGFPSFATTCSGGGCSSTISGTTTDSSSGAANALTSCPGGSRNKLSIFSCRKTNGDAQDEELYVTDLVSSTTGASPVFPYAPAAYAPASTLSGDAPSATGVVGGGGLLVPPNMNFIPTVGTTSSQFQQNNSDNSYSRSASSSKSSVAATTTSFTSGFRSPVFPMPPNLKNPNTFNFHQRQSFGQHNRASAPLPPKAKHLLDDLRLPKKTPTRIPVGVLDARINVNSSMEEKGEALLALYREFVGDMMFGGGMEMERVSTVLRHGGHQYRGGNLNKMFRTSGNGATGFQFEKFDRKEVHLQLDLNDTSSLKINELDGRVVEFPLAAVKRVSRMQGTNNSTNEVDSPTGNRRHTSAAGEHFVLIEFHKKKLAFAVKSLFESQKFVLCMDLLVSQVQEKTAASAGGFPTTTTTNDNYGRSFAASSGAFIGPNKVPINLFDKGTATEQIKRGFQNFLHVVTSPSSMFRETAQADSNSSLYKAKTRPPGTTATTTQYLLEVEQPDFPPKFEMQVLSNVDEVAGMKSGKKLPSFLANSPNSTAIGGRNSPFKRSPGASRGTIPKPNRGSAGLPPKPFSLPGAESKSTAASSAKSPVV